MIRVRGVTCLALLFIWCLLPVWPLYVFKPYFAIKYFTPRIIYFNLFYQRKINKLLF